MTMRLGSKRCELSSCLRKSATPSFRFLSDSFSQVRYHTHDLLQGPLAACLPLSPVQRGRAPVHIRRGAFE